MKSPIVLGLSLLVLVAAGCGRNMTTAVEHSTLSENRASTDARHVVPPALEQRNFRAHLNGRSEVPPVKTRAQGQAIFNVSKDGTEIHYKLIVANIKDVMAAHVHMGPRDANGPVVALLYGGPLVSGRHQGVLAEGVITAADLRGPLMGMPLEDLITAMADGNTYVNVHTTENPGGEVRGQIR